MKPFTQNRHWALKSSRFIFSFLLALLVFCDVTAGIRRVEISRYVQPSSTRGRDFFRVHGRYAGGVVPRGMAEFLSPAKVRLSARQLKLVIIDKAKLRNDQPDYDAIGIQWKGNVYKLSAQDDLIYPLMKFIQRGSYIVYTLPIVDYDEDYFRNNHLVNIGAGYIAKEFVSDGLAEFLEDVDFIEDTDTEEMPDSLKARIIKQANTGIGEFVRFGTYVNADFHVKYQVFLDNAGGKRVADVGGLPLRYYWNVAEDGSVIVDNVKVFKFPEEEFDLQYRAVLFFQTAAILRQFKQDNRPEFDRFLKEVGKITWKQ